MFGCLKASPITIPFLDSIQAILKTTTNTNQKLTCLYTLSFEYGMSDPALGIKYGKECLALAISDKNLKYQLNAYNGIANAFETFSRYDSALYYHNKSFEIAKILKSPEQMASTLSNIALCYKQKGDYKRALNEYIISYKIIQKLTSYNPRIHFYIGEIYLRLGDYVNAELHSRIGINKCKEYQQKDIINYFYINLAKCLEHSGKIDSAILLLSKAEKTLYQHTDKVGLGLCLNALGEVYLLKNEYKTAFNYYVKELSVQKELNNKNGSCLAYANLAYCLSKEAKPNKDQVKSYLAKSTECMPDIKNNNDIMLDIYLKRSDTYEQINEPSLALSNFKLYYAMNDTLLNQNKRQQIFDLESKYESAKKENQIISLQQSNTQKLLYIQTKNEQIKVRNFAIVLFVACLLFLLGYYFIHQQQEKLKNKLEKEMAIKETEEKERVRMAKDIHDDLGSGLSKINFLSEIVVRKSNDNAELSHAVAGISETAANLVDNMKDLIWALNPENTTLPNLVALIREYAQDYLEDYGAEVLIYFPNLIDDIPVSKEFHRQIFMVVKECLNNIVKHSQATDVEISLNIVQNEFQLTIKDNGKGIDNNKIHGGNGLKNMQNRIGSIGGKISIKSGIEKGTKISIIADLAKKNA